MPEIYQTPREEMIDKKNIRSEQLLSVSDLDPPEDAPQSERAGDANESNLQKEEEESGRPLSAKTALADNALPEGFGAKVHFDLM